MSKKQPIFENYFKNPEKKDRFFEKKDSKKTKNEQKTENFAKKMKISEKSRQLKMAKYCLFIPLFLLKKLAVC